MIWLNFSGDFDEMVEISFPIYLQMTLAPYLTKE